jgi:hypothetical protein
LVLLLLRDTFIRGTIVIAAEARFHPGAWNSGGFCFVPRIAVARLEEKPWETKQESRLAEIS